MCGPAALPIAAAVVAAAGTIYGGLSANAQARYESDVAKENVKHERAAADDARKRGEIDQLRHYRALAQRMGTQRAQLAASGVDVNFGTAADLQTDTLLLGYEDSGILAENTAKEVKGYEISAANYVMQGRAARARGKSALIGSAFEAGATLLNAASQVSSQKKMNSIYGGRG